MSGGRCREEVVGEGEEEEILTGGMGWYGGKVRMVKEGEAADEMMLLWSIQQPTFSKPNSFVYQSSLKFSLDACGRSLHIFQSPSSLSTPGVTGAVIWDSGVVLGKFLEHAVESGTISLQGKKVIELGSGCGLVGCVAALLGAQVILTDMQDRLRLLKKNVEANLYGDVRGSATVSELTWGDDPDSEMIEPLPDYVQDPGLTVPPDVANRIGELVLGSDVIYSEGAVIDLLDTLLELSGSQTTVILAGELRNDAVLEYFLEAAMQEFIVARVDQAGWHPEHHSPRVVMYVMVRKIK